MPLDLESLRKAVAALTAVQGKSEDPAFMGALDEVTQTAIRSGVIQHFEFTYELCWKFVQRWVNLNVPGEGGGLPRSRKDLFRLAARHGLIDDRIAWFGFGDARNQTSHTYDVSKALEVYEAAVRFLPEARSLLLRLEQRSD